jgi:hypothetical protein
MSETTRAQAGMAQQRILVAGIGNIFLGDDAFGVAVAQRLAQHSLPEGVRVADFGIRSFCSTIPTRRSWSMRRRAAGRQARST